MINMIFQAHDGIADFNILFLAAETWIVRCMLFVHVPRGCCFLGGTATDEITIVQRVGKGNTPGGVFLGYG
jgi:hypothetical protein